MLTRTTTAVCALAAAISGAAQPDWVATGGPGGGEVVTFGALDGVIFASAIEDVARSSDAAASWEILQTPENMSTVTSFATIGDRVLAADFVGGLFASDDGGQTWQDLGGPAPGESGVQMQVDGATAYLISVDLDSSFDGRLWRSLDAGESWTQILLPTIDEGTYGAISLYADGDLLLVSTTEPGSFGFFDQILRSENRGEDWEIIENEIPPLSLGIGPFAAIGDTIFTGTRSSGVFRSQDGGRSWTITQGAGGHPAPPHVHQLITVGDSVYFIGNKLDGGQDDVGPGLWRSDDLGETWEHRDDGLPIPGGVRTNGFFATGGLLLVGSRFNSLWVSGDEGQTWSKSVDGFSFANIFAMVAAGDTFFATPAATPEVWRHDGTWTFGQTPSHPGHAYGQVLQLHTDGPSIVFAGTQGEGIYRSTDGGETFQSVNAGLPEYNGTAGLQYREIEAFEGSGQTIFAGSGIGLQSISGNFLITGGGAVRSDDGGETWRSINNGLPIIGFDLFNNPLFDPILAMAEHDGAIYAGHYLQSGIFRTTNGGQSWSAVNNGLPSLPLIRDLKPFGGSLFAAGFIGVSPVWRSDDGVTWQPASQGLPIAQQARSLTVSGDRLFVGIEAPNQAAGVYVTSDGATWERIGEALNGVPIRRLATRDDGTVAAGTTGRSVWLLQDSCPADLDDDGDADAEDFFSYLDLFAAGDDRADLDGDGDLDADDFFSYLDLFAAGC